MEISQIHNVQPSSLFAADAGARMVESFTTPKSIMEKLGTLGLEGLSVKQRKHARRRARLRAAKDVQRMLSSDQVHHHADSTHKPPSNDLTKIAYESVWPVNPNQSASATREAGKLQFGNTLAPNGHEVGQAEAISRVRSLPVSAHSRSHLGCDPWTITSTSARHASAPQLPREYLTESNQVRGSVTMFSKVPPRRIDTWRRYDSIPAYQALSIPPLGQLARLLPADVPGTAIFHGIDGSLKGSPTPENHARQPLRTGTQSKQKLYNLVHSSRTRTPEAQVPEKHVSLEKRPLVATAPLRCSTQTPLSAPTPTDGYLRVANIPCRWASKPQHLLLILDLNGTLIYRRKASSRYLPRPSLQTFLDYCFANHSVLVWSSATPSNVTNICSKIFTPEQRQQLLGEWGRDTLDLTTNEYYSKTQVYKRLERVWEGVALRHSHPEAGNGEVWSQANTLLLDDSVLKAQGQPFNLVEVPEFKNPGGQKDHANRQDVLGQVMAYLEKARMYENVSAFVREERFVLRHDVVEIMHGGQNIEGDGTEEGGVRVA